MVLLLPVSEERRAGLVRKVDGLQAEAESRYTALRRDGEPEFSDIVHQKAEILERIMGESRGRITHLCECLDDFFEGIREEGSTHSLAMYKLATGVASKLHPVSVRKNRFTAEPLKYIGYAAVLHDVGKAVLPEAMKEKMRKRNYYFDEKEYGLMQLHVIMGYMVLRKAAESLDILRTIAPLTLCHHEKWNGFGYLLGLRNGESPLVSRVISVADACLAIMLKRSYDPETPPLWAIEEIKRCADLEYNRGDLIEYNRDKLAKLRAEEGDGYEKRLSKMFKRNTQFGRFLPPGYDRSWYDHVLQADLRHLEDAYLIVRLNRESQFDRDVARGLEAYREHLEQISHN